jgi:hypothetical protein
MNLPLSLLGGYMLNLEINQRKVASKIHRMGTVCFTSQILLQRSDESLVANQEVPAAYSQSTTIQTQ